MSNVQYSLTWEPVIEEDGIVYKCREEFGGEVNEGYMIVNDKMYVEIQSDAEG